MIRECRNVCFKGLLCALVGYSINRLVFALHEPFSSLAQRYYWSVESLFFIFGILSLAILTFLVGVKHKNFDQVGMTFLVVTTIKMALAFAFGKEIIYGFSSAQEKINFYSIFAFFLVVETVLTIQLLNNTPQKPTFNEKFKKER
jgi:H+/Cl- antiporter ClcA